MPVEIILPVLGETMDEGTIVKWLVNVGQSVEKGAPLYQVETDKAVLDVEAPASGVLVKILCEAGSKVHVLSVVGLLAAPGEDVSAIQAPSAASVEQRPAPTSAVDVPTAVTLGGTRAVTAPGRIFASPRARKMAAARGVDLPRVQGSGPGGRIVEKDVQAHLEAVSGPAATPVARKMAEQAGLELTAVPGAVEGRRIMRADVEATLASTRPTPEARPVTPVAASPTPVETVALSGLRGIIAQRMGTSAHTTAPVTLTTEVDATELVQLRTLLKERLEPKLGFAPSYNDILVAMVTRALLEHPYINVRMTDEGIQAQPRINVGVAVDTERGLLVPVIRDADQKGIAEIATASRELATRARAGKSTPDDLTGGTFTITNLGMFDIDAFTPIINLPECAILGIGRIREQPAAFKGQLCLRQMMVLSLTFDHRLVDGAPAARFLQRIKQLVEEPYLLLA